ncbi:RicAFT regulatory complex protein RicA family protein [Paenibacillus albiflavus]|uniref:RicAFT regulatory complex protein RicA family protein n=1 Tax=Paenibacillus albiflavus TaxID=2545760 RepID=UPI001404E521|nr:YlbF family regulator [Paenibacillus albiflavus]
MSNHHELEPCPIEHYTNKEFVVREDIMVKTKELAELITTSSEVQFFQQADKQISGNEGIQNLINQIKKKQKEIVAFKSFDNPAMVQKIENEIDQLQDELDQVPIVNEFRQSQEDINYLLQLVMGVIRDTISEKITVEEGKDSPSTSNCG